MRPTGTRPPLGPELASSISSLQSIPPGPFSTVSSGFVVSGSSAGGSSRANPTAGDPPPGARARPPFGELLAQRRIAGLRVLAGTRKPLDVAVRDHHLQLQARIAGRVGSVREAVHDEQRVRLAEPAREVGARRGTSTTRLAAGVTFFDPTSAARRSRRSSVITAIPTFAFSTTDAHAVTSAPA